MFANNSYVPVKAPLPLIELEKAFFLHGRHHTCTSNFKQQSTYQTKSFNQIIKSHKVSVAVSSKVQFKNGKEFKLLLYQTVSGGVD